MKKAAEFDDSCVSDPHLLHITVSVERKERRKYFNKIEGSIMYVVDNLKLVMPDILTSKWYRHVHKGYYCNLSDISINSEPLIKLVDGSKLIGIIDKMGLSIFTDDLIPDELKEGEGYIIKTGSHINKVGYEKLSLRNGYNVHNLKKYFNFISEFKKSLKRVSPDYLEHDSIWTDSFLTFVRDFIKREGSLFKEPDAIDKLREFYEETHFEETDYVGPYYVDNEFVSGYKEFLNTLDVSNEYNRVIKMVLSNDCCMLADYSLIKHSIEVFIKLNEKRGFIGEVGELIDFDKMKLIWTKNGVSFAFWQLLCFQTEDGYYISTFDSVPDSCLYKIGDEEYYSFSGIIKKNEIRGSNFYSLVKIIKHKLEEHLM